MLDFARLTALAAVASAVCVVVAALSDDRAPSAESWLAIIISVVTAISALIVRAETLEARGDTAGSDLEDTTDANWRASDEAHSMRELIAAREEAVASSRAKSRFLAQMSHEFRTPMTGILGMASLLSDTKLSDEQKSYLTAVEQSAQALLTLVDDILDTSKIEAGKVALTAHAFSIEACVASAIELLTPLAAAKGLTISLTVSPDVPAHVSGDERRVRQIVLNLLSNAVKFTSTGGVTVRVSFADAGEGAEPNVTIAVADTGPGLSQSELGRLFGEFEVAGPAYARRDDSSGLGLALSRKLARAMGGDIRAESTLGEGATFTVVLVLPRAEAGQLGQPLERGGDIAGELDMSGLRVLIAEDNPISALLARRVVERADGLPTVVADGRAAIDAVSAALDAGGGGFDLILMDVLMPDIDGFQATAAIRDRYARDAESRSAPPIIALTANAFAEDRQRCLDAGMDDYLAKPFDAGHLRGIVARWRPRRRSDTAASAA